MSRVDSQENPTGSQTDQGGKDRNRPALGANGDNKLILVGIGASAGGLEALRKLLPGLPVDADLVYVIVQHLDPKHRSMLTKLLAPQTELSVQEVTDGQALEPRNIYITPSGYDVVIKGEQLYLRQSNNALGPKPSVDMFFTSMAEELGERAVGLIMSGTGSDGAHGMRAIKGGGGITMVQDPTTAKYNGMPQAALDTGNVDLVLAPENIGPELVALLRSPLMAPQKRPVVTEPDAMERLLSLIRGQNGADFTGYKSNTIDRRVARRIALHKLSDVREYLAFTEKHPEELDSLAKDILISVTSFFRDDDAFQALARIIPVLLEGKQPGDNIRVWVPGCATGEEAYSISLLFAKELGENFESYNLNIFGTDIDAEAIVQARRGLYPEASLVNIPPALVERYFRRHDNFYQVSKSLREHIVFAKQDVIHNPPFSRLDLVSCRNLLIYLNSELQQKLIPLFHYALNPNGFLFLGKSESVGPFNNLFEPVDKRWRIFRRKEGMRPAYAAMPGHRQLIGTQVAGKGPGKRAFSVQQIAHQAVNEMMGVSAVVIDDRQELIHVIGDAGRFMHLPQGDAGLNIMDLAVDQIRPSLRAAIHKANREQVKVSSRKIRWDQNSETTSYLDMHVQPVNVEGAPNGLTLIVFEVSEPTPATKVDPQEPPDSRDQRIAELEQELAASREHLQTTTEELETANEELQSLNEELQSANEELQSSNEELETSNEELQATNEELTTVNEEMSVKSAELSQANADLENILTRMGIPLIVVDEALRVRRFTPAAANLFHLIKGQRGQAITTVGTNLNVHGLGDILEEVIEDGVTSKLLVEGGSRYYEMRAYPYVEEDGTHSGVIITFYDQTDNHRREQAFKALADNAPDIVARFDRQLRHIYVNHSVTKVTGKSPEYFLGKSNRDLGMPDDLCELWDTTIKGVFEKGEEMIARFSYPSPSGNMEIETRMVPEFDPEGNVATVLAVGRDITRLLTAEALADQTVKRLQELLNSITDGFFSLDREFKVTFFNKAAGKLLHCDPKDVLGIPLFDAFPVARGSIFEEKYHQALERGEELSFETYFEHVPYDEWYNVRVYPSEDGITVFFRVVTQEKFAKEERERLESELRQAHKMEAVGTLAGGIAHEFNNLLAVVRGHAEMLLDDVDPESELHEPIASILKASDRGAELIANILTFSHKTATHFKPMDFNKEVKQVVDILERTIPKMIDVELDLIPERMVVSGVGSQIQQVLLNLASNAKDAMPQGGHLRIATQAVTFDKDDADKHALLQPGDYACLTVEDDGEGMEPEMAERVFDPFFTTKGVGSGTGLGLAIVYGIVKDHHGHVHCESKPGEGTRIWACFPLSDEEPANSPEPIEHGEQSFGGTETILIVDDEPDLRDIASRTLQREGYEAHSVASGEEAVDFYKSNGDSVDLVVMDLGMPGMGGQRALAEIKAIDPKAKILIASGYSTKDNEDQSLSNGASGYVTKPISKNDFLKAIRGALDSTE